MNQTEINRLLDRKEIRQRSINVPQADSLIKAALDSAVFATMYSIDDKTATGIFKALYDAFRQLDNAKWRLLGYEEISHKASMDLLASAEIKNKFKLRNLNRFRMIRNDANYKGYKISPAQTQEILILWEEQSKDLLKWVKD